MSFLIFFFLRTYLHALFNVFKVINILFVIFIKPAIYLFTNQIGKIFVSNISKSVNLFDLLSFCCSSRIYGSIKYYNFNSNSSMITSLFERYIFWSLILYLTKRKPEVMAFWLHPNCMPRLRDVCPNRMPGCHAFGRIFKNCK